MCASREYRASTEFDIISTKLESEISAGRSLDEDILAVESQLLAVKSENVLASASSSLLNPISYSPSVGKLNSILEKRLDRLVVQSNGVLCENAVLKNQIELLGKEKDIYLSIENKLGVELRDITVELSLLVEETSRNYSIKDKAINELERLQKVADKERVEFDVELRHMNKLLEADLKVFQFLIDKKNRKIIEANEVSSLQVLTRNDMKSETSAKVPRTNSAATTRPPSKAGTNPRKQQLARTLH